tara:strand:- start:84 stop:428 length:345 start_codon:yes stop_codon:yes gene_type:complete
MRPIKRVPVTKKVRKDLKGRVRKETFKTEGEKTVFKNLRSGKVIKQKNKSEDGVRTTRKTVYRGDGARMTTKEKQRTNRKGKKAGVLSMKDKIVDRRDFSVRRKTKGKDPRGGA